MTLNAPTNAVKLVTSNKCAHLLIGSNEHYDVKVNSRLLSDNIILNGLSNGLLIRQ